MGLLLSDSLGCHDKVTCRDWILSIWTWPGELGTSATQLFKYNLHLYDDIVVCYNMLTIFSHCTIQILTIAVHASHNSTYFTFSCKYFPVVIYLSAYHTRVYHQVYKCHHVCVRDRGKRDNEQKKEVTSSTSLHAVEKSLAFQIKNFNSCVIQAKTKIPCTISCQLMFRSSVKEALRTNSWHV